MKQGRFAALCGISQPMVSKYAGQGLLVVTTAGEIEPQASLAALEGRLDETKRQQALAVLGKAHTPPAAGAGVQRRGAKAEKDEIDRDLKALELGQKLGALIPKEDAIEAAYTAVAAMREAFTVDLSAISSRLCADFGIPGEKAPALARALSREFERAMNTFSREIGVHAAEDVESGPVLLQA